MRGGACCHCAHVQRTCIVALDRQQGFFKSVLINPINEGWRNGSVRYLSHKHEDRKLIPRTHIDT